MKKILFIAVLFSCFSCSDDFLDVSPQDRISEEAVWTDPNLIIAYHNSLYNGVPHGFGRHMVSKFSDEANSVNWDLQRNTFTPDNVAVAGTANENFFYYWNRGYAYIRKVNIFLEQMEEGTLHVPNKDRLVAEAKFLRGFMYFELIRRYGGVPIVMQSYDLGEEANFTRSTFDECVSFIESDLNAAITGLPEKYASTSTDFGRATQDACKALKSRLFLYAASPLFNPSNDQAKWQKAADAAEALLNRGYSLHLDYRQMFIQPSGSANNEIIFARLFSASNSHQAPITNINRRYGGYGGWGASNGPSQNLVDDYDMNNGEPAFIYPGGVKTINPASNYNPQNPYVNRDPRFDATVLHDESVFRGNVHEMWVSTDGTKWGFDSFKQSGDNPRTNYALLKFAPNADVPLNWQTLYTNPWIHIRLAEIYLNYAEAKLALGDEATCREYINKVRARQSVNLPPISNIVTGEELKRRLYNERRIELAFEGHRFFDVRRWKIATVTESQPIYGMDITKDLATGLKTYTPVQITARTPFQEKMYLLPIEASEILRNKNLTQTPGW